MKRHIPSTLKYDLTNWPKIDLLKVKTAFREVPLGSYPGLAGYTRDQIHAGLAGQGGLFLASDMAERLNLRSGMKILDLGCGSGLSTVFLAKHFGVQVYAVDTILNTGLMERAAQAGVANQIEQIQADAQALPFPADYFDAMFSMNAFFYFGTEPCYPDYLIGFLKPRADLVIGSPCYREELSENTPKEFLLEYPECLKVHSPEWWASHFKRSSRAQVIDSSLHRYGNVFWEDRVRFILETESIDSMPEWKREMVLAMIKMLNRDTDGFVSHFIAHVRRKAE